MDRRKELEEQPRKRRKKKKKRIGYYLYAIMILVLTVANLAIATFLLTYVQTIKVTGIQYCTNSQITALIKEDPLTMNSIYAVLKYKTGFGKTPNYLADLKVGFNMPWGLQVQVTEKQVVGGILVENEYIYFADDGTIMTKRSEPLKDIYVVEGIKIKHAGLYETLELENDKLLPYIVSVSKALTDEKLQPDKILWEEDGMSLYFDKVCVKLGKLNYGEKIVQIPPILEKVKDKEGVLHLEHFSDMNPNSSFVEKN